MWLTVICQLILATFFGALIGLEREIKGRQAGLQTYSLVSLGSCVFAIISVYFSQQFGTPGIDILRSVQAIAIGVGFIGAGAIIRREKGIEGLTTAAGLWVVASIGLAVGIQLQLLAAFTTLLAIIILAGLGKLEEKYFSQNE